MNATELKSFRHDLVELARRLGGESAQLRHEVLGDERDPSASTTQEQYTSDDLSREKANEEVALGVLGNEEALLAEVLAALARIERREFGRCEQCRKPIAAARLRAVPYARFCIRCARQPEAG